MGLDEVIARVPARLAGKVRVVGDCWEFLGTKNQDGYGRIKSRGRLRSVHIVAYEAVHGPVPPGTELDHTCRNRACFRHDHLEPTTHAENVRRGLLGHKLTHPGATKARCVRGHDRTPGNIYVTPTGIKQCKLCRRQNDKKRRAAS